MTTERFLKMVTIEGEIWKDVPGFEGEYMVSSIGKVLFVGRNVPTKTDYIKCIDPHLVSWREMPNGYAQVDLWKDNKAKRMYVHRLVALAFIPNPNNYPQIDHIDTDRLNNDVRNLKWCNQGMNNLNPITDEKRDSAFKNHPIQSRWVKRAVIGINLSNESDIRYYSTVTETGKDGFNPSQVSASCLGKRRNHKGFHFYYQSEYESLINKSKNEPNLIGKDY